MPNINTTYIPSNPWDTCGLTSAMPTDTFTVSPSPVVYDLPQTYLQGNESLLEHLVFAVLFLILFAFVRLRGKELLSELLQVLFKRKKAEIILNEGISSNLICYVISLLLSFSMIATGISYGVWDKLNVLPALYIFTALILYHFILIGILHLLGWTFNAPGTASEAIVHLWSNNIMSGLLISPFIIAILFVQNFAVVPLLKLVIFSLVLFLIVKMLRWIEILFAYRVSILYMILYLCALEVMPLLVLLKLVA